MNRPVKNNHLFITGGALLFLLILLSILLPFNGLYGQDAHAYTQYSQKIQEALLHGTNLKPFFWPIMYPFLGALAGLITPGIYGTQFISVLSLALGFFYFNKILQWFYPNYSWQALIYSILSFIMAPYVLRASIVAMSDIPALLFILAAIYHSLRYQTTLNSLDISLVGLFAVMAFFTRYATAFLTFLPGLIILNSLVKSRKFQHLIPLIIFASIAALPQFLLNGLFETDLGKHGFIQQWSLVNAFKNDFVTNNGHFHYPVINLVYAFFNVLHPAYLFFGLPMLIFLRKRDLQGRNTKLFIVIFLIYALFLSGLPFQNKRFLLLNYPLILVLLFPAFQRGLAWAHEKLKLKPALLLALTFLIQTSLFARVLHPFWQLNQLERNVASALENKAPTNLYTFSLDVALKTYDVPQNLVNLENDSIENASDRDWVLFNEGKLEYQWADHLLMKNWKKLNNRFELKTDTTFQDGWTLYRLR